MFLFIDVEVRLVVVTKVEKVVVTKVVVTKVEKVVVTKVEKVMVTKVESDVLTSHFLVSLDALTELGARVKLGQVIHDGPGDFAFGATSGFYKYSRSVSKSTMVKSTRWRDV